MSEITYDDVAAVTQGVALVRLEALDTVISSQESGDVMEHYWQADVGSPVDAVIQVVGEDENEARTNLTQAAWGIINARIETSEAAAAGG